MQEWILTQKSGANPENEIKICDEDDVNKVNKKQDKMSLINKELQILGITKDRNPD